MAVLMTRNVSLGASVALLLIGVVSWGCHSLAFWSGGRGSSRTPHEEVITPDERTPGPPSGPAVAPSSAPSSAKPIRIVDLAFEILRIELPLRGVQHSRKIWNHVDELRVDPELVARLARNGVRLGAVPQEAWPAIHTILDAGDAEVHKDQLLSPSGLPLTLEVGSISDSESIFSYGPGHQLVGKTFDAGVKIVEVNYALRPEMGGRVDLQVALEVRHRRGVMTWEKTAGVIQQVPDYDRYVFSDLRAAIALDLTESLLIGPGEEARNEYVVGSRFFTKRRAGNRYETLYCITPVPHQRSTNLRYEE